MQPVASNKQNTHRDRQTLFSNCSNSAGQQETSCHEKKGMGVLYIFGGGGGEEKDIFAPCSGLFATKGHRENHSS